MRTLFATLCLLVVGLAHAQPGSEFTLQSLDGTSHTLPAEQDGVGIYLFWASWCPYCKALMPHVQSIVDEYGDAVTVYALDFRDKKDPSALIAENGYDFVVFDNADEVAESWGVHGTPGLFVIDQSGTVHLNLYDVVQENPPGFDDLSHSQKAARRAPFWAARIRQALDELPAIED